MPTHFEQASGAKPNREGSIAPPIRDLCRMEEESFGARGSFGQEAPRYIVHARFLLIGTEAAFGMFVEIEPVLANKCFG